MYDLLITYEKKDGSRHKRGYKTVMDFIDEMDYGHPCVPGRKSPDVPSLDDRVVQRTISDEPLDSGSGVSVKALLDHCRGIVK